MSDSPSAPPRRFPIFAALALTVAVFACSIYANLAFTVTDPADFGYFPPFRPHVNMNNNNHLGAEYFNIAKAMVAGRGFADPFWEQTGPTAWMPPALPTLLAVLWWACEEDRDLFMGLYIFMQVYVILFTGLLILALGAQTCGRLWGWVMAALFVVAMINDFHLWFQVTHDHFFVLAGLDVLIAGLCWGRPLCTPKRAAVWGVVGGCLALSSPIVGFAWGGLTILGALHRRAWKPLGFALLFAGLTVLPWTIRNYFVFGRLLPVKSNAAYELYQSQCLQPEGLLQARTFGTHPYANNGRERQEYKALGEMDFLDKKREQFWKAVAADPVDFLDRVAHRFLGATLWFVPMDRGQEMNRPTVTWISRLLHPLPFLALLVLAFSAAFVRLHWAQWAVM